MKNNNLNRSSVAIAESVTKRSNKIRENSVFNFINVAALVVISAICFLPFLNVLSMALSQTEDVNFTPKHFTWENFKTVFENEGFWRSMGVSFWF